MSVLSKERLVEKHSEIVCCPENVECTSICDDCDHMGKMMDKLAEYEDLEEQGLLLRLPIAIGSKVYSVLEEQVPKHYYEICEYEIKDVSSKAFYCDYEWWEFGCNDFYFTREEAEEKLRELEGQNER